MSVISKCISIKTCFTKKSGNVLFLTKQFNTHVNILSIHFLHKNSNSVRYMYEHTVKFTNTALCTRKIPTVYRKSALCWIIYLFLPRALWKNFITAWPISSGASNTSPLCASSTTAARRVPYVKDSVSIIVSVAGIGLKMDASALYKSVHSPTTQWGNNRCRVEHSRQIE